jgi:hypothetical protein
MTCSVKGCLNRGRGGTIAAARCKHNLHQMVRTGDLSHSTASRQFLHSRVVGSIARAQRDRRL